MWLMVMRKQIRLCQCRSQYLPHAHCFPTAVLISNDKTLRIRRNCMRMRTIAHIAINTFWFIIALWMINFAIKFQSHATDIRCLCAIVDCNRSLFAIEFLYFQFHANALRNARRLRWIVWWGQTMSHTERVELSITPWHLQTHKSPEPKIKSTNFNYSLNK